MYQTRPCSREERASQTKGRPLLPVVLVGHHKKQHDDETGTVLRVINHEILTIDSVAFDFVVRDLSR